MILKTIRLKRLQLGHMLGTLQSAGRPETVPPTRYPRREGSHFTMNESFTIEELEDDELVATEGAICTSCCRSESYDDLSNEG